MLSGTHCESRSVGGDSITPLPIVKFADPQLPQQVWEQIHADSKFFDKSTEWLQSVQFNELSEPGFPADPTL